MKKLLKISKWLFLFIFLFAFIFYFASEIYIEFVKRDFNDSALYDYQTIRVNDLDIAYREYFNEQDKTIVVIHGFLGNSFEYDDFFKEMPNTFDYRVIAFDLVGFGVSDKPLDYIYTNENHAKTMIDAIDLLDIDAYTLMAHSMGGEIAMRMTRLDHRIESLVLIDPVSPNTQMESVTIPRLFYSVFFKNYWLQRLGFNSAPYEPLPQETFQASLIQNDSIPSAVLQKFSQDTDADAVNTLVSELEIPSLLIYGKEDTWTPPEIISEYEAILTNVESHVIDDVGHLIYLEKPEILRSLIINFLNNEERE